MLDSKSVIDDLMGKVQQLTPAIIEHADRQSQTDDQSQIDKLTHLNNKLKRVLQTFKDKIHRLANDQPNLFLDIPEETSDRLDHLITTVHNQTLYIDTLNIEREQARQNVERLQRYGGYC